VVSRRGLYAGAALGGAAVILGLYGIARAVEAIRRPQTLGADVTPADLDRAIREFLVRGLGGGLFLAGGMVLAGLCLVALPRARRRMLEEDEEEFEDELLD
jgi:hypothetical protein